MRLSPAALAVALLMLCVVPSAYALADASVTAGGATYAVSDQSLVSSAPAHVLVVGNRVQADVPPINGTYDWINGYLTAIVQPTLNLVRTHGEACVVGRDPRHSVACYCIGFDWSCHNDAVLKWVCYASIGPTWDTQAGIVCLPDRGAALLAV